MRIRLRHALLAAAALSVTVMAVACANPPGEGRTPETPGTHVKDAWDVQDVHVKGRTVTCVIWYSQAMSCDWANAVKDDAR